MSGIALLNLLAGLLQLTVPSYGLRLVRRFGAQRVGWFLVLAFSSFTSLYLLKPLHLFSASPSAALSLDFTGVLASILLLIGMGHLEALCATRQQAEHKERELQTCISAAVRDQTAQLVAAQEELLQEHARLCQRQELLKNSEAQYRLLFAEHPQAMWIVELRTCRFLAVNQAALHRFGYSREEFMHLAPGDLMSATAASAFQLDLARPCFGAESRGVWPCCTKSLSLVELEITALDLKFADCPARLMLLKDTTERRRREAEEWRKAKTELVSRITGGTAHHFNNLLTVIQGHSEVLLQSHAQDARTSEHLRKISAAVAHAAALTHQLLLASGSHTQLPEAVELSAFLRQLAPALRRLLGEQIALELALAPRLSPLLAARSLLEHIIVHLVTNAREAMPAGGKLCLATEAVRLEAGDNSSGQAGRVGSFVRLLVRDTGGGMPPEIVARLFEPFFTTRDSAQSPGLGLASVYGAVNHLGGWLELTSTPTAGTEFRIFLPCATPEQLNAAARAPRG